MPPLDSPLSPSPLHCFLVDFGLTCAWNSPEIDVVYLLEAVEKLPSCTVAVALPATNLQAGGGGERSAQRSKAREMCFNNLPAI